MRAWNVRLEEPAPPDSAARIAQMSTSALAVRLLDNIGDPRTLLVETRVPDEPYPDENFLYSA